MRKYIVLLLITGIVWAQIDFDTIVLKNITYEQLGYEQADEHIKSISSFGYTPVNQGKTLLDNARFVLENNKGVLVQEVFVIIPKFGFSIPQKVDFVLNVNVDMMTAEEKALYISGYEKRINEMKNSTTFNNCLGIVGLYLLTVIIMFLVNPYR